MRMVYKTLFRLKDEFKKVNLNRFEMK